MPQKYCFMLCKNIDKNRFLLSLSVIFTSDVWWGCKSSLESIKYRKHFFCIFKNTICIFVKIFRTTETVIFGVLS